MTNKEKAECPNGKIYGRRTRKQHLYVDVSRTRLPKGDKRGDYHVVSKCKYCGDIEEYDCIFAF